MLIGERDRRVRPARLYRSSGRRPAASAIGQLCAAVAVGYVRFAPVAINAYRSASNPNPAIVVLTSSSKGMRQNRAEIPA